MSMANQRDPNKKLVTMWLTKEERLLLKAQAVKYGYTNVTEFVKAVAKGSIKPSAFFVAFAFAWLAAGCPTAV